MALVDIRFIPQFENGIHIWSFNHAQDHEAVNAAIKAQKNLTIPNVILDPIPDFDFQGWLWRHQIQHSVVDQALGTQSTPLSTVDPNNPEELSQWVYLNFQEHFAWHDVLRI